MAACNRGGAKACYGNMFWQRRCGSMPGNSNHRYLAERSNKFFKFFDSLALLAQGDNHSLDHVENITDNAVDRTFF